MANGEMGGGGARTKGMMGCSMLMMADDGGWPEVLGAGEKVKAKATGIWRERLLAWSYSF